MERLMSLRCCSQGWLNNLELVVLDFPKFRIYSKSQDHQETCVPPKNAIQEVKLRGPYYQLF